MRLIDADELEKKLAGYFTGDRGGEATMRELIMDEAIADTIRIIREQPTVDAQAEIDRLNRLGLTWYDTILKLMGMVNGTEPIRHGKWIGYPECLRYENALTDEDYACSCCGEVFNCISNDMDRFDYCPHCGAKMDGIEE